MININRTRYEVTEEEFKDWLESLPDDFEFQMLVAKSESDNPIKGCLLVMATSYLGKQLTYKPFKIRCGTRCGWMVFDDGTNIYLEFPVYASFYRELSQNATVKEVKEKLYMKVV